MFGLSKVHKPFANNILKLRAILSILSGLQVFAVAQKHITAIDYPFASFFEFTNDLKDTHRKKAP